MGEPERVRCRWERKAQSVASATLSAMLEAVQSTKYRPEVLFTALLQEKQTRKNLNKLLHNDMSDIEEVRTKNYASMEKISNGYTVEVFLKGEPRYGEGTEYYFPTIDEALAKIKETYS